jgi:branched-chain amino acid transport system substrate-binding protein
MVFEGPKGTYAIRPSDHQALVPMYIARLVNLDDPDQQYFELLAEVPASQIIPPILLAEDVAAERMPLDEAFNAMLEDMGE